ncbi:lytic murein transglycosylase [Nocardioides sp. R-C-SC26]|uniref:lytic murein transglycosylase n=1 Tax=Nocardioides sp. R-C-SC26 TaxID=2870414 RepID=UPI001E2BB750|nr:lytic murein transglycosylase [Nocardioides sp. R-C-SC26]
MTHRPVRAAAAFVVALLALSGVAFGVQQWLYAPPPVMDLRPIAAAQQPPLPAPAVQAAAAPASGVPLVDPGWIRRTAQRAGIPEVAVRAYARAELMAPPACGLGWTTLAGIGWIESQHGTIGGRTLGVDGWSSSRILGPPLDGVGPVKAIPSTPDSVRWHGNPDWDHAVGPMQFIPSTWAMWARDGDGDGTADPNDLDDAAYAAAEYLCADGRDLASAAGWSGGVLSYNNARSYLESVHDAATTYAERTAR